MNKKISTLAKNLRKNSTDAEKYLWKHLRNKQLEGLKFRRQEPIGEYIVDFVCFEKCIIIELDGSQHAEQQKKDFKRDRWLIRQGFKVLRFWNNEILKNIEGILEGIMHESLNHPPLTPPIKGGEYLGH
ncbi:MAG: endonuclease domain-containing protein [Planctomycetes bacterium]|nr:endonuclease domain-containing protein [Planctomycetota bacterium]